MLLGGKREKDRNCGPFCFADVAFVLASAGPTRYQEIGEIAAIKNKRNLLETWELTAND
jgi:hypothetical protein